MTTSSVSRLTAIMMLALTPALASTAASAATVAYGYDAAGRLTQAGYAGSTTLTYTYDAAGNVIGVSAAPTAAAPDNYTGIWWNAPPGSESGWGVNFAHEGDTIFATWFTFGLDGKPAWLVVAANKTGPGVYTGNLFTGTGPPFNAVPFDPAKVVASQVGTATFTFADASNATFAYVVNGTAQSKSITRQIFSAPSPTCTWSAGADPGAAVNFQSMWWKSPSGSESGWGINFAQQGATIFATWFTFGLDGKPTWLVVGANRTAPNVYTGTLFTGTGPPFNSVPFDPAAVTPVQAGTATFTFAHGNSATFAYTVNGVSQTKAITRQPIVAPGTICQ